MRLVTDNAQGELSPLEIGIHALGSVEMGEKGRGKTGGLSDYARQIGKSQSYVSKIVAAARVFEEIKNHSLGNDFSEKTKHLYEISLSPETTWPLLCEALESGALTTVEDVSKAVARIKGLEAALPSWWHASLVHSLKAHSF